MVNGPPQHAQTEAFSAAMAGILIYTAAPDSEGTLGGLVSLGQTATLEQHLDQALESLEICSSDPLCAEAQPEQEYTSLRGSARHTCKRSASAQPRVICDSRESRLLNSNPCRAKDRVLCWKSKLVRI